MSRTVAAAVSRLLLGAARVLYISITPARAVCIASHAVTRRMQGTVRTSSLVSAKVEQDTIHVRSRYRKQRLGGNGHDYRYVMPGAGLRTVQGLIKDHETIVVNAGMLTCRRAIRPKPSAD